MSTIGVSIPIPQPWREQLDNARIEAGDPNGGIVPAHVTLLGPTEVPRSDLDSVERHLHEVAEQSRPFTLHLRGTGSFRPITEVVFVAIAEGISSCEQLAGRIRSKLLWRPLRFPYHPHVTIAHDVDSAALDSIFSKFATFEAKFEVDSFTWYLHKSEPTNTEWLPQRTFALRAA
ncbi:2'-5' RNA ligase family protein [Natronoglycomyces albus]|uniref:2'-5' RNA ligase family protein n=2 Tax=Natronoglycomyces albus TaxID=2811108 RepID=A0A895XP65_9ACTN|nr:2'-5' RNA ligase family protein [Natronoglycomyces albus]